MFAFCTLDQLKESAQRMYMEPKQADDFWYEMDEYSEMRPGESTEDHFQRLFRFGFIPLRNRTRAFITDVKKLAESLGKSQ